MQVQAGSSKLGKLGELGIDFVSTENATLRYTRRLISDSLCLHAEENGTKETF